MHTPSKRERVPFEILAKMKIEDAAKYQLYGSSKTSVSVQALMPDGHAAGYGFLLYWICVLATGIMKS